MSRLSVCFLVPQKTPGLKSPQGSTQLCRGVCEPPPMPAWRRAVCPPHSALGKVGSFPILPSQRLGSLSQPVSGTRAPCWLSAAPAGAGQGPPLPPLHTCLLSAHAPLPQVPAPGTCQLTRPTCHHTATACRVEKPPTVTAAHVNSWPQMRGCLSPRAQGGLRPRQSGMLEETAPVCLAQAPVQTPSHLS